MSEPQRVDTAVAHEQLEGWLPPLATDEEIRIALEKAFDYRGDVTITRKDGAVIEGYLFDRRTGRTLTGAMSKVCRRMFQTGCRVGRDEGRSGSTSVAVSIQ